MAKDTLMWAKIIRELDPTLSNDPHKRKRRIGDAITELNANATEWIFQQSADTHGMMDSFMADQKIAKHDLANQNS